jgi:hypothetical protein
MQAFYKSVYKLFKIFLNLFYNHMQMLMLYTFNKQ